MIASYALLSGQICLPFLLNAETSQKPSTLIRFSLVEPYLDIARLKMGRAEKSSAIDLKCFPSRVIFPVRCMGRGLHRNDPVLISPLNR